MTLTSMSGSGSKVIRIDAGVYEKAIELKGVIRNKGHPLDTVATYSDVSWFSYLIEKGMSVAKTNRKMKK